MIISCKLHIRHLYHRLSLVLVRGNTALLIMTWWRPPRVGRRKCTEPRVNNCHYLRVFERAEDKRAGGLVGEYRQEAERVDRLFGDDEVGRGRPAWGCKSLLEHQVSPQHSWQEGKLQGEIRVHLSLSSLRAWCIVHQAASPACSTGTPK